ncbi:hypothetical protein [Methanimicrococcus hacksteinii]|uniref:hypothetical protein n=1 Tax=Methanimicrococcus hacksteinii TaxID=3028293 RepID=UPI00298F3624|nr:hypothetical protein [Methanimicrococcus sp. At1]
MKSCAEEENFSKSSFFVLSFNDMIIEQIRKCKPENNRTSKREFWKQYRAEILSQLSNFKSIDPDLEKYIVSGKFIDYERNHYCRNYFILSSNPVSECGSCHSNFKTCNECCTFLLKERRYKVLGFFSLSGKTMHVQDDLYSKKLISRFSRISVHKVDYVETYLVGHLSKNYFNNYNSEISGNDILLRTIQIIKEANSLVGVNVIRIDCIENEKIIRFYQAHGFKVLHSVFKNKFKNQPFGKFKKRSAKYPLIMMVRSVR